MAKNQNTFAKRHREVEKKRKAEDKKERRRRKKEHVDDPVEADSADAADDSVDDVAALDAAAEQ